MMSSAFAASQSFVVARRMEEINLLIFIVDTEIV